MVTGRPIRNTEEAFSAGAEISRRFAISAVAITLDSDGIALVTAAGEQQLFRPRARAVCDVTGAGDMVLAMLGMCVGAGLPLAEAIPLANLAAGLEIEKIGTAVVTPAEILAVLGGAPQSNGKLLSRQAMSQEAARLRRSNLKLVLTNGCFDLLHAGHLSCLRESARAGDRLVVAINSDRSVRQLKGPQRPIIHEIARANLLAALECVDYVVIFDEPTPHEMLRQLQPDVLVKGGTYAVDEVVGKEIVESYGGRIHVTGMTDDISTTEIINSIVTS
jgi:D-beta-D-heptose 7-phosphate kinase/D-beta-D-heptose 1-phosphate adenosyltransferase